MPITDKIALVITSIQAPTPSVFAWLDRFGALWKTIVIGDRKGPSSYDQRANFYDMVEQGNLDFLLPKLLPENHYSRKNIGYLLAISSGTNWIVDTDDDNAPLLGHDFKLSIDVQAFVARPCEASPWINVYRYFTDSQIWPRGYPLTLVNEPQPFLSTDMHDCHAPVQQHLVNLEPDVDAIWRLVLNKKITFTPDQNVFVPPGAYCPFNSQATFWHQSVFPLLYIPSTCSMRLSDTWRSFVAQRCLKEEGIGIVFSSPGFEQDRNTHSLMDDFENEILGYINNDRLIGCLDATKLVQGNYSENVRLCYRALVEAGLLDASELILVDAWIADVACCLRHANLSLADV